MTFEILTSLLTVLSIIGVILNIRKMRICFYIWAFTNASWMVIDFYKEVYAQSALFFVYFVLAIWGIYKWRKDEKS